MSLMKSRMNSILALCFLVMLSVEIVGGIQCLGCSKVGPDDKCITKPYECTAGKWEFCFIERFSRLGKVFFRRVTEKYLAKTEWLRMKIQMNDFLLLCVLVMLSLEIVGGAQCEGCDDIAPDNMCKKKPYVCTVGRWQSCFIRRSQKRCVIHGAIFTSMDRNEVLSLPIQKLNFQSFWAQWCARLLII
ncbi:UNVERIFIED_CONTAM: hypothetical protein K2H54_024262 [Gekko kuhli]